MTCEECLPLLDALVDGDLAEDDAVRAMLHLGGCDRCAGELARLECEQRILREFIRAAKPSARLGVEFRAALAREPRPAPPALLDRLSKLVANVAGSRPRLAFALAALALLVTPGLLLIDRYSEPSPPPQRSGHRTDFVTEQPPAPADIARSVPDESRQPAIRDRETRGRAQQVARTIHRRSGPRPRPASVGVASSATVVARAEERFEAATAVLTRELEKRRGQLDADAAARLDSALGEIDRVIASSRDAVRRDPSDPRAVGYLTEAYLAKVNLLRRATSD